MERSDHKSIVINDGFWKKKTDMVKEHTIDAVYKQFKNTHRFDALKCFWREGDTDYPHVFWDSDVAKWIEGAAYILERNENKQLEAIIDEAVDDIVANSDENGYFNSHYIVREKDKGFTERFTDRNCHELYCAGHLIEAAVAYYNATGKDKFLKAMCKYADYIEKVFKIENSAAFCTPGHPELELALVRLYDATKEKRYLELAKHFIDIHGAVNEPSIHEAKYNQDNGPLRKRSIAEGHCVRAMYLYSAMADIAERYDDNELLEACKRIFDDVASKKAYITGGIGSTSIGEAFTVPYHLPNRTAYNETCAAISLAMFCMRMQMSDIDSKYADMVERAVYNGVLSGVSLDGKKFFYVNPLEIDPKFNSNEFNKENMPITQRVEVFECSCCPPNIVRFIPSIADYMYTYDDDTVYVHQYIASNADIDGTEIIQETNYPNDGIVRISQKGKRRKVALRIPYYSKDFKLNVKYTLKNGYAYIDASDADEIVLKLDMRVRFVKSDRRVHENAGRVAVMRGPVVYCAEGIDNGDDLKSIKIDTKVAPSVEESEFLLPTVTLSAYKPKISDDLYYEDDGDLEKIDLKLIPYNAFANRGESEMLVWFLK